MRVLWLAGLLIAALSLTGQDNSPGPPPEPPNNRPACNNFHDSEKDNCHCPKAMRDDGTGSEGSYPHTEHGESWCRQFCVHDKCNCVSPMKHLMPYGR